VRDSQALILKSLPSLELLHSLALQRCFSAEQISKRPLKEVEGMHLYTPQSNPTITCQLSKIRVDRTRRSTWPDAPVYRNGRKTETLCWVTGHTDQGWPDVSDRAGSLLYFDLTRDRVRSVMTGCVWSSEYLTRTWPDAPITSQSRPIRWFPFCDTSWTPRPVLAGTASGQQCWGAVSV
jgi:hypothetical protein